MERKLNRIKTALVEPHVPTKHIENPTKGLCVTFPDGTVIWHKAAINTFVDALRKVGLERIPQVGVENSIHLIKINKWRSKTSK